MININIRFLQMPNLNDFHLALQSNDLPTVLSIIRNPIFNIDEANPEGMTALHIATFLQNNIAVETLIIERHAAIDAVITGSKSKDFTALHISAAKGNTDLVKILIDNGANIEAKESNGKSPIRYAANSNKISVVKLLIEAGASLIKAEDGTPIGNYSNPEINKIIKGAQALDIIFKRATGSNMTPNLNDIQAISSVPDIAKIISGRVKALVNDYDSTHGTSLDYKFSLSFIISEINEISPELARALINSSELIEDQAGGSASSADPSSYEAGGAASSATTETLYNSEDIREAQKVIVQLVQLKSSKYLDARILHKFCRDSIISQVLLETAIEANLKSPEPKDNYDFAEQMLQTLNRHGINDHFSGRDAMFNVFQDYYFGECCRAAHSSLPVDLTTASTTEVQITDIDAGTRGLSGADLPTDEDPC